MAPITKAPILLLIVLAIFTVPNSATFNSFEGEGLSKSEDSKPRALTAEDEINSIDVAPNPEVVGKLKALPGQSECGLSGDKTGRVVGGVPAKRGAWPWLAAIGLKRRDRNQFFCGGTLISDKLVITAAHCMQNEILAKENAFVRLGTLYAASHDAPNPEDPPMDISIESSFQNPLYGSNGLAEFSGYDIGIIVLKSSVQFTDLIRPICIPLEEIFYKNDFENFQPFVAGWGLLNQDDFVGSETQMQVQLPIISREDCRELFEENQYPHPLHTDHICTLAEGKDACQGDSGGPLMLPYEEKYYLYGIVSFGYGCASENNPGIFNKVHTHLTWLAKTLDLI